MDALSLKIKEKNKSLIKKTTFINKYVIMILLIIAISLLVINSDTYLTYSILLIFLSLILGMIYAFLSMLRISSTYQIMLKHSVDIAYQSFADRINMEYSQTFVFQTEKYEIKPWFLLPSFIEKDITYCLNGNPLVKLYKSQAYTTNGTPPNRTYYFDGLYVDIEGVEGDIQYRDKESIGIKLVNALSSRFVKDSHDIEAYQLKRPYESGMLYSNDDTQIPEWLKALIYNLSSKEHIKRFSAGIKEGHFQIAIELKSQKVPYVKSYKESELKEIKQYVEETVFLLNEIQSVVFK